MKDNDKLETPAYVWKALGNIDLDPCAGECTQIGRVNYALEREQDGLELPWHGFVFCNPPFSQKEPWIKKMIKHGRGILLLPERGSAPWFTELVSHCGSYWVMGKKINFIGGSSSNNIGSCLFAFGMEAHCRLRDLQLPGHHVRVERVVTR